jgi:glycerol uptake facilitator-like aquaporin
MIQSMPLIIRIVEVLGAILGACLLIWLKYWQIKSANDSRKNKADVQTLFSGKK